MPFRRSVFHCLAIVSILMAVPLGLIGCTQSLTERVFGTVSIDGVVLEDGQIEFTPTDGTPGPIAGGIIQNGKYEVPAVTQGLRTGGTYKVSIISMKGGGRYAPDPNSPSGQREILINVVPSKFNEATELRVKIIPGENQHDFALNS
jgi:hypothetical protein